MIPRSPEMPYTLDSTNACNDVPLGPSLVDVCSAPKFLVFMSLLNTLVRSKEEISGRCKRVKSVKAPYEVYDFIVAGGGAAGSVVASRLSEISDWKVKLIEAGPDSSPGTDVPSFAGKFLDTKLNWNYKTTNESHACLSTNGSCTWPAGKNLGGSTVHNHMVYLRGCPTDYNNWAKNGNEGWSWEKVKKYFLLAENNCEIDRVGKENHNTGGPLPVQRFPYFPKFGQHVLQASEEVGYGVSEDLNGEKLTGFSITQAASKNGVRYSSARAYLWPARNRKNLHICLDAFVTKILIKDKRAVGVEYFKNGKRKTVYATREVILSAGTMRSPHILLLSGIGPKEHLKSVNVKVVHDLPGVGKNLQDHVSTSITCSINETDVYDNDWHAAYEYITNQTGPLSGTGLPQMVGMLASNETAPDYPDFEIFMASHAAQCATGKVGALKSEDPRTVIVMPTVLHPKSRGSISLPSNDPHEYPVIWANYLGDQRDVHRLIKGIKMVLPLFKTKALRAYNFTMSSTPLEACSNHKFLSDEYWACFVRYNTVPEHHQVGTCKMGPSSDPLAVVDPQLRVHGIKGLRVADASIMPTIISANTAASTMMIGERAADFIKKYWYPKTHQKTGIRRIFSRIQKIPNICTVNRRH